MSGGAPGRRSSRGARDMNNRPIPPQPPFWRSRRGIVLLVFLGIGAFLLLYEHRAHIPGDGWLLGGLLVLCVLMHGFMHGGHGHGSGHRRADRDGGDRMNDEGG